MEEIKLKAFAKINLGLDVIRKREDGYHEVRMIMQTIGLYDKLTIRKSSTGKINIKTNLVYLPVNENNLVYKAIKMLTNEFKIEEGVEVLLEKRIPVAAGMAGGSTDAAAALVGINRLFELGLNKKELMKRAVKLGADVPYCILRGTALSEGIGEILTPISSMPLASVLIVKPPISISTQSVYKKLQIDKIYKHPDIDGMIEALNNKDLYGVTKRFANVLESVTTKENIEINKIKKDMLEQKAINALMSGSGPTVFGIYDNEEDANKAFEWFKLNRKGYQIYLTKTWNKKKA